MLRNIAGIMADEEPKTPISPSGLYNSSDLDTLASRAILSNEPLSGLGEFTFMTWANCRDTRGSILYREVIVTDGILIEVTPTKTTAEFKNSNGGTTIVQISKTNNLNEWHHWAITGSVSNNRIRLYEDGVLIASAVMTYPNRINSLASFEKDDLDIAQTNMYNRELTEAEVLEHYVYDDDTMSSGVLGWDAMTPAQRSGLIYSSSYTDDISISGNEFHDKSGSGITISQKPSLTGEQIYFYTDASDLPSDYSFSKYYRIHKVFASYDPTMTLSNEVDRLRFDSTTSSLGGMYLIVTVKKTALQGNKIYTSWSRNYTGCASNLFVYDGLITGSSSEFVNGSLPSFGTAIYSVTSGVGVVTQSTNVPDLTSYGDDVTIILSCSDDWIAIQVDFDILELELRDQSEQVLVDYAPNESIVETGTDGTSKYGTIG